MASAAVAATARDAAAGGRRRRRRHVARDGRSSVPDDDPFADVGEPERERRAHFPKAQHADRALGRHLRELM